MRVVLVALLFLSPLALASPGGTDPAGDERATLAGAPLPDGTCHAPAADIVAYGFEARDGLLVGTVRVLDARADAWCASSVAPLAVSYVAKGATYPIYDASLAGVSLGAVESRDASGASRWGPCAFVTFADGRTGAVPGFPCAPVDDGPAAESWSIPLAGSAVLSDGTTRDYALPTTSAFAAVADACANAGPFGALSVCDHAGP